MKYAALITALVLTAMAFNADRDPGRCPTEPTRIEFTA